MTTSPPSRRTVLHGALATAALAACGDPSTPGVQGASPDAPDDLDLGPGGHAIDADAEGPLLDTGWADTAVVPPSCSSTTPFAEGPYFLSDAPDRTDLRSVATSSGTAFTLALTVRSEVDCLPMPGALVELWHCDPDGDYDMESDDMRFRCRVRTNFAGEVVLSTYKPVPYPLDASRWMPAHFHLKVYAAGHDALTTQLRFTGDPHDDGTLPSSLMLTPRVQADGSELAEYTLTLAAS